VNVPNILTAIRFILIPIFAYYLSMGDHNHMEYFYFAVFLFLLAGLTDILDGYIARKYNLVTSWGKLADPLADKLMQITALVMLSIKGMIFIELIVLLAIVVIKEIFMGIGSIILYKQDNYIVSANWYGKMSTVILYFAIVMTIFRTQFSRALLILAILSALFAFIMYARAFQKIKYLVKKI